jgi:hypothetical protein
MWDNLFPRYGFTHLFFRRFVPFTIKTLKGAFHAGGKNPAIFVRE